MDLSIEFEDIKILYIKCTYLHKNITLEQFAKACKRTYVEYYDKQTHSGNDSIKTFSQWINKQIISLN